MRVERQFAAGRTNSGFSTSKIGLALQHRVHAFGRVERKRLAFAQSQQPGDVVDVAIGEHGAGDRAMAPAPPADEAPASPRSAGADRARR